MPRSFEIAPEISYFAYWGKARPASATSPDFHLVPYPPSGRHTFSPLPPSGGEDLGKRLDECSGCGCVGSDNSRAYSGARWCS